MSQRPLWLALALLLAAGLACNFGFSRQEGPFVFPTPRDELFPSLTPAPNQNTATPKPSPSPTPTPRIWPSPFFGETGPTPVTPVPTPFSVLSSAGHVNFLLIGSDQRGSLSLRTDVLIIVNIQPEHDLVTMISVPRDLFIYIPGWTMQRINAAYQHGAASTFPGTGEDLLKDTILYNLGVEIDYLALVDFEGFRRIVDTMEGIEVPTACSYTDWRIKDPDLDPEEEDNWELFTVGPGIEQMDGDLALWYVRSRIRSNDFDRGRRQQEVLRALYSRGTQLGMLTRLPQLYRDFRDTVSTDISLEDLIDIAPLVKDLASARIRSYYINNNLVDGWRTPQGASVLVPDARQVHALMVEALSPPDNSEELHLNTFVEIWNGTENEKWDLLAAERLAYGGYESKIELADNREYSQTLLYDYTPEQDVTQSNNLLSLLGLPASRLIKEPDPSSYVSYRLILGADYRPCFNPARIPR